MSDFDRAAADYFDPPDPLCPTHGLDCPGAMYCAWADGDDIDELPEEPPELEDYMMGTLP